MTGKTKYIWFACLFAYSSTKYSNFYYIFRENLTVFVDNVKNML